MSYRKKVSYLPEARSSNNQTLGNYRILLAIIGGVVSGVLGFDGMFGFVVFFVYSFIGTIIYYLKLGNDLKLFYTNYSEVYSSWKNGIMEYILTWM